MCNTAKSIHVRNIWTIWSSIDTWGQAQESTVSSQVWHRFVEVVQMTYSARACCILKAKMVAQITILSVFFEQQNDR
jgi:hypothetical protein